MSRAVWIDICCNDPDNGLFDGRAEAITGPDLLFELTARRDPAPKLVEGADFIRLAGKRFTVLGSKDWVGNWCWNRYAMEPAEAARLLIWLHRRQFYTVDQAEERIFNMWRLPHDRWEVRPQAEFLERQMVKAMLAMQTRQAPPANHPQEVEG